MFHCNIDPTLNENSNHITYDPKSQLPVTFLSIKISPIKLDDQLNAISLTPTCSIVLYNWLQKFDLSVR